MEDEAVRVGVAFRLGLSTCVAHECRCDASVDTWGLHVMVYKKAPARSTRHHALNDIIARAITSAGVPVVKEPSGLSRSDGKRPDGLTLKPWQNGKALTWDVTVATTLADSYLVRSSTGAGSAAELAASKKVDKYAGLPAAYLFQPLALETLGPVNCSGSEFLNEVGRRLSLVTGEPKEELNVTTQTSSHPRRFYHCFYLNTRG